MPCGCPNSGALLEKPTGGLFLQDYAEYEIVFGVSDPSDPAIQCVERLRKEFPERSIQLVICPKVLGPNVKVSNLEHMVQWVGFVELIVIGW